ncbi:3-deoxy-D-manno-octulosonic-acid transferase [Luteimonas sp. J16]|uniref:lipid IV(A) 3-deoxy-D-manno-octulosonic acid transferase n=1 Tax=Luteimonas sp. J16 TaxID=935283 RepID=UPI0011A42AFB|nr:lipid IV(A) 3-deoxy-D-manno-octulosonic acid transferase [Luteimonas sp. J16]TWG89962.1 3-deoxy-D-manno-octulosonic-acid transferase [Luteimonas sp. J16]
MSSAADTTERLLRGLYSTALYLLVPATVYHLIWRGFRQEAYLERWSERYARYADPAAPTPVWVHAVSVGEVNAVAPLVDALIRAYPDLRLLVTTITPTGSARVRALWGDRVDHVYLPYDLSGAVRRFLAHFSPKVALVVETELWPNLLLCCRDAGIPAYLVNARLSEKSLRGYRLLRPLLSRVLATLRRVAAQSEADARRFQSLGAPAATVTVTGNLKYDIAIDTAAVERTAAEFRERAGGRPAWIAASTHPEEEAAVLAIHRRLRERWPDALLLWAPRHPERFRGVAQQAIDAGWRVATRRLTRLPDAEDAVFVIDTLGELQRFYACADVADVGGHNLLEPAAVGVPVVTGPHLHNFTDIADRMQSAGALEVGADADAVGAAIEGLLEDEGRRAAMRDAGLALVRDGRGAVRRTLAVLAADLPRPAAD